MRTKTTAERLHSLMQTRNLKQVDIIKLCEPYCKRYNVKLNKNDLSQYVNGKVEPGQFKLTVLSHALNVSEAWLMGYDIPMTPPAPAGDALSSLSPAAVEIAQLYDQLDASDQGEVRGTIKTLLRAEKYERKNKEVV